MAQLIRKDSPLTVKAAGFFIFLVLSLSGVVVLPLLILFNTGINFNAGMILFNKEGYTRQKFRITEYSYRVEYSGPDIRTERYFTGTVHNQREYLEDLTFARYSPQLDQIIENSPEGRTSLDITIEIWYNPDMAHSWFTKGNEILPYRPDFFSLLSDRLRSYLLLWILFVTVWVIMYCLPKTHDSWSKPK